MGSAEKISVFTPHASLAARLQHHPRVANVAIEPDSAWDISFGFDGPQRHLGTAGRTESALFGLVELVDNNPLVCAETFAVLPGAEILATIALQPVLQAGLVLEAPVILTNAPIDETGLSERLDALLGWKQGAIVEEEPVDLGEVVAVNAIIAIPRMDNFDEIDALFQECYGRTFTIRLNDSGDWDVKNVLGRDIAEYRLRLSVDESHCLLTVQTMADRNGMLAHGQLIHAMNVMCGFDDALGLNL